MHRGGYYAGRTGGLPRLPNENSGQMKNEAPQMTSWTAALTIPLALSLSTLMCGSSVGASPLFTVHTRNTLTPSDFGKNNHNTEVAAAPD